MVRHEADGMASSAMAPPASRTAVSSRRRATTSRRSNASSVNGRASSAERVGRATIAWAKAGREAAGWRAGFRAALARLLRTVAEQPLLAKALLIEVRAARGQAWAKHQQLVERLATAVDLARREPGARPDATPLTAQFVVGAIEEALGVEIGSGRAAAVERLLPDLAHLAVLQYFGEDEAWLELGS